MADEGHQWLDPLPSEAPHKAGSIVVTEVSVELVDVLVRVIVVVVLEEVFLKFLRKILRSS